MEGVKRLGFLSPHEREEQGVPFLIVSMVEGSGVVTGEILPTKSIPRGLPSTDCQVSSPITSQLFPQRVNPELVKLFGPPLGAPPQHI